MSGIDRALVALACLAGLLGVAASAAAAHIASAESLKIAAQFLLFHAPAIIALTALAAMRLVRPALGRAAAGLLVLGLCLFCGDLSVRALLHHALFPMAAPTGGFLLMGGWLLGFVGALLPARGTEV